MRKSNFELLRIISMLMIVMGHMSGQALNPTQINDFQRSFYISLSSGSRIAVSFFLMTGLWFMVDSKFSPKRVLKLYGALWFWSVLLTYILVVLGQDVSTKDMISCFFPVLRRWMWFVPVYIVLLLFSPFLNKACNSMSKSELQFLVILGLFFLGFVSTVSLSMDNWYCAVLWFIYMYFAIFYYKHYLVDKLKGKKRFLLLGLLMYIALLGIRYGLAGKDGIYSMAAGILAQYFGDYKSIPNLMCSVPIFIFFSKIDIGSNRVINSISKYTMDVYLIHQTESFYPFLWKGICRTESWQSSDNVLLIFVAVSIAVFAGCSILGMLRARLIEPLWLKSRLFGFIENKMNKFYSCINNKEAEIRG